jgi:hypothetical protein
MGEYVTSVSRENQIVDSSKVYFIGDQNASYRVLVIGNSITRHGPKEDIGWFGDWGMAASSRETDFVHRLYAMMTESGKDVYMRVRQGTYWECNFLKEDTHPDFAGERDFKPDLIVFRLGDNVKLSEVPYFKDALIKFIDFLKSDHTKIVFTTVFYNSEERNSILREVAAMFGSPCAEIVRRDIGDTATGLFEHSGVAGHPGDRGMEMIAKNIFDLI